MVVVMLMEEQGADDVEEETDGADNQNEFGVADVLDRDEALDRLEEDTEP